MLTGAVPDCGPQPGGTSPAIGWSVIAVKPSGRGGGHQGGAATELLTKNCQKVRQNIIFRGHVRSSKRSGRGFCQNRYFFLIKLLKGTVSRDFLIRFMTLKTKSVLFVQALIV
jgi:hypothetical protein